MAKAHNDRAEDEAKEIKQLNKSIFRPSFTWNKQAKRDAAERRIVDRHENEREQREEIRRQTFESRERVGGAFRDLDKENRRRGGPAPAATTSASARIADRGRYAFEADEEDDEVENELDENLGEIGDLSKRLNLLARAAGDEVRAQNKKLGGLSDKVRFRLGSATLVLSGPVQVDRVDTDIYRVRSDAVLVCYVRGCSFAQRTRNVSTASCAHLHIRGCSSRPPQK
jgi:hypothetical protein